MDSRLIEEKYQELQLHWKQGNLNAFLRGLTDSHELLKPVRNLLLPFALEILDSRPHLISPQTYTALRRLPLTDHTRPVQSPPANPVGRMSFPVINARGLVRDIQVSRQPGRSLNSERLELLDNVGSLAAAYLRIHLQHAIAWCPSEYYFEIFDVLEGVDHNVTGGSMGLPLGLALFSIFTVQPVPAYVSATGEVRSDGSIGAVSGIREKLDTLARERHFVTQVLVSSKQEDITRIPGLQIIPVSTLGEAIEKVFPCKPRLQDLQVRLNIDELQKSILSQYQQYLLSSCMENCSAAISFLKSQECPHSKNETLPALFNAYWKLGSSHCHKGRVKKSWHYLQKAHSLYKKYPGLIPHSLYLDSQNNYAVLLKDIFQYEQAEKIHWDLVHEFELTKGLFKQQGKNLSSLSQLYLAMGRVEKARDLQKLAIRLLPREEHHRNYGYLAQVHTRSGQFDKARRALDKVHDLHQEFPGIIRTIDREALAWIRAEYLYSRWRSQQRKQSRTLQELHEISFEDTLLSNYPQALVYKFQGLSLLESNNSSQGLQILDKAVSFLESHLSHMYFLLAASIRAPRAEFFLQGPENDQARQDIKILKSNLSKQKDIKEHFKPELQIITRYLCLKKPAYHAVTEASRTLKAIQSKIPY
jgi:tetratricopeptide (TPR) repeat protein